MSIVINDPELERDLRALAAERGESVEALVRRALSLERPLSQDNSVGHETSGRRRAADPAKTNDLEARIRDLQEEYRRHLVDETSTDDELLGYDEDGLPR
jgi:hypothetical protein